MIDPWIVEFFAPGDPNSASPPISLEDIQRAHAEICRKFGWKGDVPLVEEPVLGGLEVAEIRFDECVPFDHEAYQTALKGRGQVWKRDAPWVQEVGAGPWARSDMWRTR